MNAVSTKQKSEPNRSPSREQRREINELLRDTYDTENKRYRGNETDDTLAALLEVMPGWVAEIREDFYGPVGSNEDMAALKIEVETLIKQSAGYLEECTKAKAVLEQQIIAAKDLHTRLARIEAAVGERVMRRV